MKSRVGTEGERTFGEWKMDNDKVMKFNFRLSIRDPSSPVHQTYPPRLDSHFSRVLHSAH